MVFLVRIIVGAQQKNKNFKPHSKDSLQSSKSNNHAIGCFEEDLMRAADGCICVFILKLHEKDMQLLPIRTNIRV